MFKDVYNNTNIYGNKLLETFSLEDIKIIDIREPFEVSICKVPGSDFIPMNTLIKNYKELLVENEVYYILCHTGQRSYYITDLLTKKGYNVVNIVGGIASIKEFNVPY